MYCTPTPGCFACALAGFVNDLRRLRDAGDTPRMAHACLNSLAVLAARSSLPEDKVCCRLADWFPVPKARVHL